ncbi:hypothetical protein RJ641_026962 [Dillenia turbinata]|uniref:Uncharacterized protein n=1 Tax=Dillenia turbinata TaxID=194707 RepID=A0AAN8VWL3_9MAGN
MATEVECNILFVVVGSRHLSIKPVMEMVIDPEGGGYIDHHEISSRYNPDRPTFVKFYPKGVTANEAKTYMTASEIMQCTKITLTYENGKVTVGKVFKPNNVIARIFLRFRGFWKKNESVEV